MRVCASNHIPSTYHALELRSLRLVGRDAAEQRARQSHVCAPAAVGEDGPAAVHGGVLIRLPILFLVFGRLALGLYVYLPVRQLHGEAGVLALAADGQRKLVVGYDYLRLLLVLVQVDLAHARGAQGLRYKARRLGVPLDDVYLLVPELGDNGPHTAPARPHAGPDGIHPGFLGPHGHLRAQPGLAGDGPYLDEAVVDLGHLQLEEVPEQPLMAPAHGQAGTAPSLPYLQQVHLEALAVLVALVRNLLAGRQNRLDPTEVDQGHPPVGLLHDAGNNVAHALAVLVQ